MFLRERLLLARRGLWEHEAKTVKIQDLIEGEVTRSHAFVLRELAGAEESDRAYWQELRRVFIIEGKRRGIQLEPEPLCDTCGGTALYLANGKAYCKLHKFHAINQQKLEANEQEKRRDREDEVYFRLTGRRRIRNAV